MQYDLRVWPFTEADGSMPTSTPGKLKGGREDSQMIRLAKLTKKHRNGMIEKVDWLDRLTFREIELINEKEKRSANKMFLMVEFALIHFSSLEYLVIYFEKNGDRPFYFQPRPEIVRVPDPEIGLDNLVEAKHLALSRASRTSAADRDLKPNAAARNQLNNIIGYPSTVILSTDEKDLVWKFRYYCRNLKISINTATLPNCNRTTNHDLYHCLYHYLKHNF